MCGEHNHLANRVDVDLRKTLNKLKKSAVANSSVSAINVLATNTANIPMTTLANLPSTGIIYTQFIPHDFILNTL